MKQEAKHIVETAAVLAAGNTAVWTMQDISLATSIVLGMVSIIWVSAQLMKFLLRWFREELLRRESAEERERQDQSAD